MFELTVNDGGLIATLRSLHHGEYQLDRVEAAKALARFLDVQLLNIRWVKPGSMSSPSPKNVIALREQELEKRLAQRVIANRSPDSLMAKEADALAALRAVKGVATQTADEIAMTEQFRQAVSMLHDQSMDIHRQPFRNVVTNTAPVWVTTGHMGGLMGGLMALSTAPYSGYVPSLPVYSAVGHLAILAANLECGATEEELRWRDLYDAWKWGVGMFSPSFAVSKNTDYGKSDIITGIVEVQERPAFYVDADKRLHREDGPAVRDSSARGYFWHGTEVNERLIEHPEQITVDDIDNELNAEIHRCMTERYVGKRGKAKGQRGISAYVIDSGAEVVDQSKIGTLWRRPERTIRRKTHPTRIHLREMMMVEVLNSTPEPDGSVRTYFLRVDPRLRPMKHGGVLGDPQPLSALNAIASTFGMTGSEYQLAMES